MISENSHWSVDCDNINCLADCDTDSLECDGWIDDENDLIEAIVEAYDWVYDAEHDKIFCCEECRREWLKYNKEG